MYAAEEDWKALSVARARPDDSSAERVLLAMGSKQANA